ncbi:MAG: MBL fold metallo-hydrolase, partial [Thermoanaerobaculia bacterium]
MKIALIAVLLATVASAEPPKTARSEFALAEKAAEEKNTAAYLEHLQTAVALDREATKGSFFQYHLARALALSGKNAEALATLTGMWSGDEGQMIAFAEHDPAFAKLRGTPGYAKVRTLFDELEVEMLPAGGSVYEIRGAGCTLAASIGEDGVLLVDSGYPGTARAVVRGLATKQPAPRVRYLVNTHGHYDHVGANHDYAGGALIVAHPAALEEMKAGSDYTKPFGVPPIPPAGRAKVLTDRRLSIPFNGETVHVIAVPAHTPGDLVVWFETSRVLHVGDDYFGADSAYLDPGSAPSAFFAALREVLADVPDDAVVISGHAARVPA